MKGAILTPELLAERFRSTGLNSIFADFIEATSPFNQIGAQLLYIFEPLLGRPGGALRVLGSILEDPIQVGEFVRLLRRQEGRV
jgi:hypothetical protein